MEKKHYDVVAAVVVKDGKFLCMQRCRSKYMYISEHWEFPGGQVEPGESHHETLVREIKEEMDSDLFVGRRIGTVDYDYEDFSITLTAYRCMGGDEKFKLLEHLDYQGLPADELLTLRWTAADEKLIREFII